MAIDGPPELHVAAAAGRLQDMERLLKSELDIDAQDADRCSALHVAAWHNQKEAVEMLLRKGADVNMKESHGRSPLFAAACNGSTDAMASLLNAIGDPSLPAQRDAAGASVLHAAAKYNQPLVAAELKPWSHRLLRIRDRHQHTPIHTAVYYANHNVLAEIVTWDPVFVRGLLNGDNSWSMSKSPHVTPTSPALEAGGGRGQGMRPQPPQDASPAVSLVGTAGEHPPPMAAGAGESAQAGSAGAQHHQPLPPQPLSDRDAVLGPAQTAAQHYDEKTLEVLVHALELSFKADPTPPSAGGVHAHDDGGAPDASAEDRAREALCALLGWSPVHWAIFRNLEMHVGMNLVDADGQGTTALHLAAGLNRTAALSQLLSQSRETKARRVEAAFASLMGKVREPGERVRHLVDCAAETRDLISELSWDYSKCCNATDSNGRTPLHVACQFAREQCVVRLVEEGADLDAADSFGWTPLHHAAEHGDPNIISILIASNANVNATAQDGTTAVTIAAAKGSAEALALLLSCPNAVVGVTPIIAAIQHSHLKVLKMICAKSVPDTVVQPCAESEGGALGYALTLGNIPAVEVLLTLSPALSNTLIVEALRSKKLPELKKKQILHFLLRRMKPDIQSIVAAAYLGEDGCLEILLEGDPSKINHFGIIDPRVASDNFGVVTPLQAALAAKRRFTVTTLLEIGANPNVFAGEAPPPLMTAVLNKMDPVIKTLLSHGASPNEAIALPSRQRVPITPITTAVELGMEVVCKWLYRKGADLECKQGGIPPMLMACREKRWDFGRLFLSRGAAVNVFMDHHDLGEVGPLYYALRDTTDRRCLHFLADILESLAPPPQESIEKQKMSEVKDSSFTVLQAACTRSTLLGVRALLGGAKAARTHPGFIFDGQTVLGTPEINRIVMKYGPKIDCIVFVESPKRAQAVMWELSHSKKGNNHHAATAAAAAHPMHNRSGPLSPPMSQGGGTNGAVRPTPPTPKRRAMIVYRSEQDLRQFNCLY